MQRPKNTILTVEPPFHLPDLASSEQLLSPGDPFPHAHSPLWMAIREPLINELIGQLKLLHNELRQNPDQQRQLYFSRKSIRKVREAYWEMIRRGEEDLHRLSGLICRSMLDHYQVESVVIGEINTTGERFSISQGIMESELYSTTDLDLGNRQLGKLRFFDGRFWSDASLVANVVEYLPTQSNPFSIHRIISRIKAEEEIWNKVVDEIFDLDNLVKRDKTLCHLSRYVKDVFGIKLVVGEQRNIPLLQQHLEKLIWDSTDLAAFDIENASPYQQMKFVEVKDYLTDDLRKQSGWEALKSVVIWGEKAFEIQIQPLRNFLRERELLTRESHDSFRARREAIRGKIAQQVPLFGFYRELLRWLFQSPEASPPSYHNLELFLTT